MPAKPDINFLSSLKNMRLRVHLDLNKTVILSDIASGKDISNVVNNLIADCAYGSIDVEKKTWIASEHQLSPYNPSPNTPNFSSYSYFIAEVSLPFPPSTGDLVKDAQINQEIRDRRNDLLVVFTEPGHAGEKYRSIFEFIMSQIQTNSGSIDDIIPSFWDFIDFLGTNTEFEAVLALRTFGNDLPRFILRFNDYCDLKGFKKLKITTSAVFFRSVDGQVLLAENSDITLPANTLFSQAVEFYSNLGCKLYTDFAQISEFFEVNNSVAIRDHYQHWSLKGEANDAGKLLLIPKNNPNDFHVFLDDHIRVKVLDKNIVDVRYNDGTIVDKHFAFNNGYLVIVRALFAFLDPNYFSNLIESSISKLSRLNLSSFNDE
ncbi:hypothetical protein RCL1_005311 [Eukaryota sp. TZLM3-RCL]